MKSSGPGDLFFNYEFNFANSYRTIQIVHFMLGELWQLMLLGSWPILSEV